jgi:hypothetical protein
LRIHKKFGNTFSIPNHLNFFAMTNHRDALPISPTDRRWLVLFSPASPEAPAYFDRLFADIADDSKIAAVMQYLLDRIIALDPHAPAPMTESKREMVERAENDIASDLRGLYEQKAGPFEFPLVRVDDLVNALDFRHKHAKSLHREARAFLDTVKARKLRRYKGMGGRSATFSAYQLYAIRNHDQWDRTTPADVATAYQKQHDKQDQDFG